MVVSTLLALHLLLDLQEPDLINCGCYHVIFSRVQTISLLQHCRTMLRLKQRICSRESDLVCIEGCLTPTDRLITSLITQVVMLFYLHW